MEIVNDISLQVQEHRDTQLFVALTSCCRWVPLVTSTGRAAHVQLVRTFSELEGTR